VVWLSAAQLVSWGTLYYSFNVLLAPMQRDLGWTPIELSGAFSLGLFVASVLGVPVGAWIDQRGARALMTGGSLLAAAMLAAWSATDSLAAFYAIWALLGVSIATTLYEPAFAVVTARFGQFYRKAITVMTLLGGLASTVFIPLTQGLVSSIGWRPTLIVLAAFNALVCGTIHFVLLRPTAAETASRGAEARRPFLHTLLASEPLRRALRQPTFWALFACFTCANLVVSGIAAHLVPLLTDRGASIPVAVTMAALFGPAQVAARLVTLGADRWLDTRRLGRIATVLLVAAILVLAGASAALPLLWLFPILFGIGNGSMTIVRGTAVPEFLSRTGYATINGALVMSTLLARAVAPVATAMIWSVGGYDAVIAVFVGLTGAATVAFWIASGRRLARAQESA
jgi:MFS family permease